MKHSLRIELWHKTGLGLLLIGLLFVLGGHQAFAQENSEIILSASAGFDGYCKVNSWIPVRVEVSNAGADVEAQVQVVYSNINGGSDISAADISLPAQSHKEFFIYFYSPRSSRVLTINVVVEKKVQVKQDIRVTCLNENDLLIGLLSDTSAAYHALSQIRLMSGTVRVAQLKVTELPDQAQGWDGLDALVIAGQDAGLLTNAQRQSLQSWVADGGKLLLVGGLNWQMNTSGLGNLLPVSLNSTKTVNSLAGLEQFSVAPMSGSASATLSVGQLQPGAVTLAEQDGYPLLVQKMMGSGVVYFLAADPGLAPLASWNGMQDLYTSLFAFRAPRLAWADHEWTTYDANRALATLSELGIPSIFYICGWLVLYILTIGPLNYLALRLMKRMELAWLTIPALSIFFIVFAYFYGFLYRGTRPILNRLTFVQAWDGVEQARVQSLVGVYSPSRAKYTLEAENPLLFYPYNNSLFGSDGKWYSVQQPDQTLLQDVQVEIGGMQAVFVEGMMPALTFSHDLSLDINSNVPRLTGTITNLSPYTLRDVVLVTLRGVEEIGDLAPSASYPVSLTFDRSMLGQQEYINPSYWGINTSLYPAPVVNETDQIRRQEAMLSAVMGSNYYVANTIRDIYLLGWVDGMDLPDVGLQDRKFNVQDTLLYALVLTPKLDAARPIVTLPPSLFLWEASAPNISPLRLNSSYLPAEGYTFHFRPAFPIQFSKVRSLILHMDASAMPKDMTISVWDFEAAQWVALDISAWGDISIPKPERYVDSQGEIRLKMDDFNNNWMDISMSNFTLVVER